ncbi:MAG TPA: HDIG domain-containing protein, partial [Myxococcales bacterium]|nr:HDIG domain-containing protein [Myxococcales bacterium]
LGLVGCFALFGGRVWSPGAAAEAMAAATGGALFTPLLVLAVLPLAEGMFGYTTDLRLLDLANLNHPALKELIVKAPGTYHHSIVLGALAEAAAEAVGANALLAKVSAYYHDLGKGKNPLCFGENQKGQNRHDQLSPEDSAALIRQHVQDGVDLGRQYKLPRVVLDVIPQHHGTRLVGQFFQKAVEQRGAGVDDGPFRYAGPKPQSREAAVVMIADGVEAASRILPQAAPGDLADLVRSVIDSVVGDGQLDECDLTLRDLSQLAGNLTQTLQALHQARPEEGPRPPLALAKAAPAELA